MSDWLWWFRTMLTLLSATVAAVLVCALAVKGVLWLL